MSLAGNISTIFNPLFGGPLTDVALAAAVQGLQTELVQSIKITHFNVEFGDPLGAKATFEAELLNAMSFDCDIHSMEYEVVFNSTAAKLLVWSYPPKDFNSMGIISQSYDPPLIAQSGIPTYVASTTETKHTEIVVRLDTMYLKKHDLVIDLFHGKLHMCVLQVFCLDLPFEFWNLPVQ